MNILHITTFNNMKKFIAVQDLKILDQNEATDE